MSSSNNNKQLNSNLFSNSSNLLYNFSNIPNITNKKYPIKKTSLKTFLSKTNTISKKSSNRLNTTSKINIFSSSIPSSKNNFSNNQNSLNISLSSNKKNSITNQNKKSNIIITSNNKNSSLKNSRLGHITTTALKQSKYNSQEYTISINNRKLCS